MTTHNDNTALSAQTGGDEVRTVAETADDGTIVKTQVVKLDAGGQGGEELVSDAAPMPTHDAATYAVLCEIRDYLALIAKRLE